MQYIEVIRQAREIDSAYNELMEKLRVLTQDSKNITLVCEAVNAYQIFCAFESQWEQSYHWREAL